MRQYQTTLETRTEGKGFTHLSGQVQQAVADSGIDQGLCTVFIRHTSASLILQENADPSVRRDLTTFMAQLVPEHGRYQHGMEGPDDMPAHIRSMLTNSSEQIPIAGGRLQLGTWQGLYLWEHRTRPHHRKVLVHILGE